MIAVFGSSWVTIADAAPPPPMPASPLAAVTADDAENGNHWRDIGQEQARDALREEQPDADGDAGELAARDRGDRIAERGVHREREPGPAEQLRSPSRPSRSVMPSSPAPRTRAPIAAPTTPMRNASASPMITNTATAA